MALIVNEKLTEKERELARLEEQLIDMEVHLRLHDQAEDAADALEQATKWTKVARVKLMAAGCKRVNDEA